MEQTRQERDFVRPWARGSGCCALGCSTNNRKSIAVYMLPALDVSAGIQYIQAAVKSNINREPTMASPGLSPISEDGEVGELFLKNPPPPLAPSAFAAVAAAAAALSAPAVPLTDISDEASQQHNSSTGALFEGDLQQPVDEERGLEQQPMGPPWGPSSTVLLLPPGVAAAAPSVLQQHQQQQQPGSSTSESSQMNFRVREGFSSMELDGADDTPEIEAGAGGPGKPQRLHPMPISVAFPATPAAGPAATAAAAAAAAAAPIPAESAVAGAAFWAQQQRQQQQQQQHQHQHVQQQLVQQQQQQQQQPPSSLAAGYSTERIAAVLASVDSRQASVETAANFIYRFAAAVPPPHVAAAAVDAATHAAAAASREAAAAAAAAAAPGIPPSPIALRALTRTAGANAAAAAAAAAGALPLSVCYLMLDAYRRGEPKHRLAVFYVFHRLIHLSSAARGGAEVSVHPGSIEDAGYAVFVLPVVQELSHPEMDSVRPKMLRCIGIWREWGVYSPSALRQIRQLAAKGTSFNINEPTEAAAAEAWLALLQLQPLKFLAQTPSGEKAYLYAYKCFKEICKESSINTEIVTEGNEAESFGGGAAAATAAAAEATIGVEKNAPPPAAAATSAAAKRQKGLSGSWEDTRGVYTPDGSRSELEENDSMCFIDKEFSISSLRLLTASQLATCGKLFDRASRVTGQEYLLLQSSLMDLSGLLQMQHQRLIELRDEMQQFALNEQTNDIPDDPYREPSSTHSKEDAAAAP